MYLITPHIAVRRVLNMFITLFRIYVSLYLRWLCGALKWPRLRSVNCVGGYTCVCVLGFLTENVRLIETRIPSCWMRNHQKYIASGQIPQLIENLTY